MTDVDMGGGGAAAGFKLFGTLILKEESGQRAKEEEDEALAAAKPVGVEEAAAAARGSPALACPRCRSRETKFCYFNNYNVNQPRHFCKACHRYWTAGGTLRNVPVGAGRRKARPQPAAAACRNGGGGGDGGGEAWPYSER